MNRQLSSGLTVIYKFVFPGFWLAISGSAAIAALVTGNGEIPGIAFFTVGVLFFVFWCRPLKRVYAVDDGLIIDNFFSQQVKVPYADIKELWESGYRSPREIRVFLKRPCQFGKRIAFLPSMDDVLLPWEEHPVMKFLLSRTQG